MFKKESAFAIFLVLELVGCSVTTRNLKISSITDVMRGCQNHLERRSSSRFAVSSECSIKKPDWEWECDNCVAANISGKAEHTYSISDSTKASGTSPLNSEFRDTLGADTEIMIVELENRYREASDSKTRAYALCEWEQTLMNFIRQNKGVNRVVFSQFQPDIGASRISITIRSRQGSGFSFSAKLESRCDQIEIRSWAAGIYGIGDGSIFRFSGEVPFPLESKEPPSSNLGLELNGGLIWADTTETSQASISNGALFDAQPKKNHLIFKGDANDLLTFVMLDGIGLVYMHGKGSIVLNDGSTLEISNRK